jgi:hypothetical protein
MTTPRVTELPRRLEPVDRDTFVSAVVLDFPRPAARATNVVALRSAGAVARLRPRAPQPPPVAA